MKVVYLWKDGTPVLVFQNYDGEYEYPNEQYTEVQPPAGIYQPFYFDGKTWIGQAKEDWEKQHAAENQKDESLTLDPVDLLTAQLLSNDIEHNKEIEALQKDVANLTSELLKQKVGE